MTLSTAGHVSHLTAEIQTDSNPQSINTESDNELIYINICSRDNNGTINTAAADLISFQAEGAMQTWFGSGNPKPVQHYLGNETTLWNGRALLILRRNENSDPISVTISSESSAKETIHFII